MKKLFVILVAMMFLGTACAQNENGNDADKKAKEESSEGKQERSGAIEITGKEYSFDAPSTMEGGFVEINFKNSGKLVHEAGFIQVDPETTQDEFIKDFKSAAGEEGNPIAAYLKPHFISDEVKAGGTGSVKQSLPAGTYFLICTLNDNDSAPEQEEEGDEEASDEPQIPDHFEQGMIKKVTVTGPENVELPKSDAVVTAKDHSFEITGLKAGKNEMLFRNDGPKEIHMAVVMEFGEGITEANAQKSIDSFSSDGPPPEGIPEPEELAFGGIFDPGGGAEFAFDAKADRVYAFVCFIQDRAGGPPHVAKGMSKLAKVSAG